MSVGGRRNAAQFHVIASEFYVCPVQPSEHKMKRCDIELNVSIREGREKDSGRVPPSGVSTLNFSGCLALWII